MSRDLARERLKSIRSLQGWREAYKAAGLTTEGSDATKRRRLSRLINTKTSGSKKLDSKQRTKINRTYRRREKKGTFTKARAQKAVDKINKSRNTNRKNIRRLQREGKLTQAQAERRLRQNAKLNETDMTALEEAFENAEMDGGKAIRREYSKHLSQIDLDRIQSAGAIDNAEGFSNDFIRKRDKALRASFRDWKAQTGDNKMTYVQWKAKATANEQERNAIRLWLDKGE